MEARERMKEAARLHRYHKDWEAIYAFIGLICNSREFLPYLAKDAMRLQKFEIARSAMRSVKQHGTWTPAMEEIMRELMRDEKKAQERDRNPSPAK